MRTGEQIRKQQCCSKQKQAKSGAIPTIKIRRTRTLKCEPVHCLASRLLARICICICTDLSGHAHTLAGWAPETSRDGSQLSSVQRCECIKSP